MMKDCVQLSLSPRKGFTLRALRLYSVLINAKVTAPANAQSGKLPARLLQLRPYSNLLKSRLQNQGQLSLMVELEDTTTHQSLRYLKLREFGGGSRGSLSSALELADRNLSPLLTWCN